MALRATEMNENGREPRYYGGAGVAAEVVPALEKLRPLTESDPGRALEPIVETRLSGRKGESS